jgi:hypothetical protein
MKSNTRCFSCGKEKLSKDEVGINKKILGREIVQFYCIDCFSEYLGVAADELLAKIEEFKGQGCYLFE